MRYLEFYSGIGGHRCAINEIYQRSSSPVSASSAPPTPPPTPPPTDGSSSSSSTTSHCCRCLHTNSPLVCLAAFDVSTSANDTYAANFPQDNKRPSQKPIEQLTKNKLDSYHADLWVMSPPCQPYTRQRVNQPISKKDVNDRRAASFTHLTFILPTLINPPQYILLENVVGFETSISGRQWLQTLQQCQYNVKQFILSPLQFGIPNARPRYFCIARKIVTTAKDGGGGGGGGGGGSGGGGGGGGEKEFSQQNISTSLEAFIQPGCQCWKDGTFATPPLSGPVALSSYLNYHGQIHSNVSASLVPLSTLSR